MLFEDPNGRSENETDACAGHARRDCFTGKPPDIPMDGLGSQCDLASKSADLCFGQARDQPAPSLYRERGEVDDPVRQDQGGTGEPGAGQTHVLPQANRRTAAGRGVANRLDEPLR